MGLGELDVTALGVVPGEPGVAPDGRREGERPTLGAGVDADGRPLGEPVGGAAPQPARMTAVSSVSAVPRRPEGPRRDGGEALRGCIRVL
jgi:hypothetical protein